MKGLQREVVDPDRPHLYAALCCGAAARCYDALGMATKQAARLVQAGAVLCENGSRVSPLAADLLGWTELQSEAIGCFLDSVRLYVGAGQSHAAAAAMAEMASLLVDLEQRAEASRALQRAADLLGPAFPLTAVELLTDAAGLEIELDERKRAAQALSVAVGLLDGAGGGGPAIRAKRVDCRVALALLCASQGKFDAAKTHLMALMDGTDERPAALADFDGVDQFDGAQTANDYHNDDAAAFDNVDLDLNPATCPPITLMYYWIGALDTHDFQLQKELAAHLAASPLFIMNSRNRYLLGLL